MAFFDNLSRWASEMSARAVQKTKDFSEVARLNSMISDEERKIQDIFLNIGQMYVTKHNDDADDEFKPQISAVAEANSRIVSYKQQILNIRGSNYSKANAFYSLATYLKK